LGGRGRGISEFKASLVYRVSSRTARAIQRNQKKKKKKKERKKKKVSDVISKWPCLSSTLSLPRILSCVGGKNTLSSFAYSVAFKFFQVWSLRPLFWFAERPCVYSEVILQS
jgi:hypothetical protein